MRLRALLKNILQAKDDVGAAFREGNFALAEVKYAAGDIKPMVIESVGSAQVRTAPPAHPPPLLGHRTPPRTLNPDVEPRLPPPPFSTPPCRAHGRARRRAGSRWRSRCWVAQKRVEIRVDNIAGVKVPVFKAVDTGAALVDLTGLSKGGQQITKARSTFAKAVDVLVQLATLQTSFVILDEAIKVTSRRVNALDTVVIPKIVNTVEYIKSELDELEREEFFRLKRSQDKKKKDIELKALEKKAEAAAAAEAATKDLLKEEAKEDVVF